MSRTKKTIGRVLVWGLAANTAWVLIMSVGAYELLDGIFNIEELFSDRFKPKEEDNR